MRFVHGILGPPGRQTFDVDGRTHTYTMERYLAGVCVIFRVAFYGGRFVGRYHYFLAVQHKMRYIVGTKAHC